MQDATLLDLTLDPIVGIKEGMRGEGVWTGVTRQSFLGDEGFVRQRQTKRGRTADDVNIPTIPQRSPAKP